MSDNAPPTEPHRLPLNVLPHSGKVDQLRAEMQSSLQDRQVVQGATPSPGTPGEGRGEGDLGSANSADSRTQAENTATQPPVKKLIEGKVIAALQSVYDPEIPVNIYELGLIYGIEVDDNHDVKVTMTLTAPGCPVAGSLPGEVERKIEAIPEVHSAEVILVWEPAWTKDRMSEAAMLMLGF
jgi:FeS assembly SUF system protein